jgi:hypothetical protein
MMFKRIRPLLAAASALALAACTQAGAGQLHRRRQSENSATGT